MNLCLTKKSPESPLYFHYVLQSGYNISKMKKKTLDKNNTAAGILKLINILVEKQVSLCYYFF